MVFGSFITPAARRRWLFILPLGAALLGSLAGCPDAPTPDGADAIFPEGYRASYVVVRDCRNSVEHSATIRVWVNALGADAYLSDQNPLPEGTIVVKEEFAAGNCDDDADLEVWSAMRKEAAGFDHDANDWHFQEVLAPSRTVRLDDKATCIRCHGAEECRVRDLMCTVP